MAKIVKKLTDLVGNTPLMELSGYCGKYGMEQNIIAAWKHSMRQEV